MILIISAVFPPEPVVSANLSFDIASLLAIDHEVTVISPYPTRPYGKKYTFSEIDIDYSFKHIILDSYTSPKSNIIGRFRESYSLGRASQQYIENNFQNIDVIYANTWPLFSQKYVVHTANKYNIPIVLHIQDIYPESISKKVPLFGYVIKKIFLPMDKNILKASTEVITISHKMKHYLIDTRKLNANKINVVRNWQNDDIFVNFGNINKIDNEFIFMYVGSINQTAGVDLLIHAFGKLVCKNSKLVIAGSGPDKLKCQEISEKYDNIEFIDVSSTEVPVVQSKSDVLILPLRKGVALTALPSKLTAYMLSGKPIIASIDLESEAAEIIIESECGVVIEPENESLLIETMKDFMQNEKSKLEDMGKKSHKYAISNLSKVYNLPKITTIIKNLLRTTHDA